MYNNNDAVHIAQAYRFHFDMLNNFKAPLFVEHLVLVWVQGVSKYL